jgi:hypothetical protein
LNSVENLIQLRGSTDEQQLLEGRSPVELHAHEPIRLLRTACG